MSLASQMRDDRIRDFDFELDQLLMQLVLYEHPEWRQADGSCPACWLEIERMRARASGAEALDA